MSTDNASALDRPAASVARSGTFGGTERVDARMLVVMRCVFAFSGLAVVWLVPSGSQRWVVWTYGSFTAYCILSLCLLFDAYRSNWPASPKPMHWVDVLFYSYLIGVTGGGSSFFFLFFFYPILVSSFSWGFREGLLVTIVSTVLFSGMELMYANAGTGASTNDVGVYAAYLFLFGYMISYLGGYERLLTRRLALLKEINNPWNPRFGVSHVNGVNLDRLREFYDASSCVLILQRMNPTPQCVMHVASRDKPGHSRVANRVDENAAAALGRLPTSLAAYYHGAEAPIWSRYRGYSAYDFDLKTPTKNFHDDCATWANLLDTAALVTVPYSQHDGTLGRLFLTSDRDGFTHSDIEFLAQVSDTMATVIENMSLVEELVSKAAEHERLAISRDLHDTTIQPYIGLKLALDALYRDAGPENLLSKRISELIEMTEMTVRDLRDYAATLKQNIPMPGEFLVEAVKKQADRLGQFYGIHVEVTSFITPLLNGRLAGEAFQIISEGLSNVLRHTPSKNAFVSVLCENSRLLLQIGNETTADAPGTEEFMPRSIFERTQALKGTTFVERNDDRYTVVHVTLPM